MDVSIIIVSWNTSVLLGQCLRSIFDNPPPGSFDVVVIDNASKDGSAKMVRENYPQTTLIENEANVGFSRANNQGIRISQGRYIILLNSDTLVHPESLRILLEFLDSHPDAGIAGAHLQNPDGTDQHYPTSFPTLPNQTSVLCYLPGRQQFNVGMSNQSQVCEVERVQGAFLAIRREVIEQIGMMEESLFLYAEEDDLCQRARMAGWKVFFLPQVLITHYGGASTEQVSVKSLQHLYRSKLWFIRKYHGKAQARLLKLVLAIGCLIRGAAGIVNPMSASARRARNYMQLLRVLHTL